MKRKKAKTMLRWGGLTGKGQVKNVNVRRSWGSANPEAPAPSDVDAPTLGWSPESSAGPILL